MEGKPALSVGDNKEPNRIDIPGSGPEAPMVEASNPGSEVESSPEPQEPINDLAVEKKDKENTGSVISLSPPDPQKPTDDPAPVEKKNHNELTESYGCTNGAVTPLPIPEPATTNDLAVDKSVGVQEKDQAQRPINVNVTDDGTQPQDQATSVDQLPAQNGDGAGQPGTVEHLVSNIRTIRNQLDKLLESYSQISESLPRMAQLANATGRQDHDKGGNVSTVTNDTKEEDIETVQRECLYGILPSWPEVIFLMIHILIVAIGVFMALNVLWYSEREKLGVFDLEGFFLRNPEAASQWEQLDRRAIRILVTGKTGTGKSALINGLIGRNVTKEGDTLDPTTSRVEQIKQMVHGISMSVFDSPGLQDGTSREQEYLQDMQQKCEKVDLVLYAIKMTDQRVHAADTKAMKKITDAFGHKFWEKALFVMTFANEVRSPEYPDDDYENKIYFEKRLHDWIEKLPSIIEQRSDIPIKTGKRVPIIPAGYYKIRDLPGRKFWFSQFWKAALERMMESSAEGAGYMLQFSQDRLKNYNDTTEEDFQKPIHEQPILSKIVDE